MTIPGVEKGCSAVDLGVSVKSWCAAKDILALFASAGVWALIGFGGFDGLYSLGGRLLIYKNRRDRCVYAQLWQIYGVSVTSLLMGCNQNSLVEEARDCVGGSVVLDCGCW
jgi:hypothetical protein